MIRPYHDRIHPLPFWESLRRYTMSLFRMDLQAGLTVAVFAVPQAIAYAMLAEIPPIHGLYAAMVVSIVAALWGSAPHVNSGPTNSASLLTAAALAGYAAGDNHLRMVFLFTLMVGVFRMALGLIRFGGLINFVPESAFMGFTMGVGSMIALGRLHHLFGIPRGEATWFPLEVADKVSRIGESNPHALAIGLITLLVVFGLNRHAKKYPVALLAIVLGILYSEVVPGVTVMRVGDIQAVPSGLPAFVSPFFPGWPSVLRELFAPAMAVAVVGLIEAVSIGQTLAVKHRQHLNFNQEFFGQGLGLAVSAFFQGMPGSGSFSRSALIEQCGGKTRFANVWFGLATALVLLFLPGLLERIPTASLAGLLLFIGVRLIDPVRVKRLFRTSRMDVVVMLATLLITVLVRIEYGIFTGVILGALLILHRVRELHIHEVLPCPDGSFEEIPYTPGSRHEPSAIVGISVHGDLFYGVAHELLEQLNEIATLQDPKIVVLRTRRAFSIDFSCWNAIFDFAAGLQKRGCKLYLAGIDAHTKQTIHDARAHKWIPDENLFTGTDTLMESFGNAMRKAAAEIGDRQAISGVWRDWLENPVVVTEDQVREIQRFLRGES